MNNGSQGIQPVVELATNNGAYPYPVVYGNNGGFGNGGFFGGDGIWAIILIALLFGNGGWGGFGGFGGGFGAGLGMTDGGLLGYAIGNNATKGDLSDGFNSLHLSNQIEGTRDAIHNVSTQLCDGFHNVSSQICNSSANVTNAITNGFYNAEISANNRQMADMQQNFNNQIATLNGFNNLGSRFDDCCCENRLATCQTQNTIISESANNRFASANNTRDIIASQTQGTQAILDKLCQLELDGVKAQLDAKNDRISELQREISMKDLAASQVAQTAQLRLSEEQQFDAFYNRLKNCPVNAVSVYGNQPVFTCPGNNGCGCGTNFATTF